MNRFLTSPDAGSIINHVIGTDQGGSGQTTAPLALQVFDGVSASQYNQPLGVAGLNNLGVLDFTVLPNGIGSSVSLTGPEIVYVNTIGEWKISNYDSQINYIVSCSGGFITRDSDSIYYTAPATPGTYTISINDKVIDVTVSNRFIKKPTVTFPVNDTLITSQSYVVNTDTFTVNGNPFLDITKASDESVSSGYGISVSMVADGSRIAVGSWLKSPSGVTGAGQVYIYTRSGNTWVQEVILTAADKTANDNFGVSVAFDSTGARLAVGAHGKTVGGVVQAGQVYIYTRSGTTYTLEATISAADKATSDQFGRYVCFDTNATRLAVGSIFKDVSGVVDAGQVYIYVRSGTAWTQENTITAFDKATNDVFGHSVSFNTDASRLAVGAINKDVSGIVDAGQVYIYSRSGVAWTLETVLNASDKATGDLFGASVLLSPDGTRLAVSAWTKDVDGFTDAGKVYFYKLINGAWIEEGTLVAFDKATKDIFGSCLTWNQDQSLLSIGAIGKDQDNIFDAGGVYTYDMAYHQSTDWQLSTDPAFNTIVSQSIADTVNKRSWTIDNLQLDTQYYVRCRYNGTNYGSSEWSDTLTVTTAPSFIPTHEIGTLTAYDKASGDQYGVGISFDATGARFAVGAYEHDVGGTSNAGQVYIYTRSGTTYTLEAVLFLADKAVDDRFGASVSFNSDGSLLVVGCHYKDVAGVTDCGAVYTYKRTGTSWALESTLSADDKSTSAFFGVAVAIDLTNTRLIVGSHGKTVGGVVQAGQVYIYTRSGTTWVQESIITAFDYAANNFFGGNVCINGDASYLGVGAHNKTINGISGAGQMYFYTRSGTAWTLESTLVAHDPAAIDWFGGSCALTSDGQHLAVGAHFKDVDTITNAGQLYVYVRNQNVWEQEAQLIASDRTTGDLFGSDVTYISDGSLMAVSAFQKTVAGLSLAGQIYFLQ